MYQVRDSADPATLVGRGKLDEIRAEATAHKAPLIIFDGNLSPMQQRNIEEATECRVIDRTQLILDIFAKHARSREGQLQVELAQLNYMLPRLTGKGTSMSRLGGKSGGGGSGGAGGGAGRIGVRGPGEKKLETDRRRIRDRVSKIQAGIEAVRKTACAATRSTQRRSARHHRARWLHQRREIHVCSTRSAAPKCWFPRACSPRSIPLFAPFACRRIAACLSPTPSDLFAIFPKGLLTAFRATLEEVQEAAVILHVSDVSNPHHDELDEEVDKILNELGVTDRPKLRVLNKVDLLSPERETLESSVARARRLRTSAGLGPDGRKASTSC